LIIPCYPLTIAWTDKKEMKMQKIALLVLCAGLLAGCGKKPSVLDTPPAPQHVLEQQRLQQLQ